MIKKINIIGSHGLYASYGGWDQLVINLVELKSQNILYRIFNPKDTPKVPTDEDVLITKLPLAGSGVQGLIFDCLSLSLSLKADTVIMLGIKAIPFALIIKIIKPRLNIVVNIGGIEWERPQFNFFLKLYLKFCFLLTKFIASKIIIDNEYYKTLFKEKALSKLKVIAYGGTIDHSLKITELVHEFPFLDSDYFLSISRSIADNKLNELCNVFSKLQNKKLVLISNFSNSSYGIRVFEEFKHHENIHLIDGLYDKRKLDLIRRSCKAYIHTHTLCGSAPSLIEMIACRSPIYSIDVIQNKFTLENEGIFFSDFDHLEEVLHQEIIPYAPTEILVDKYQWTNVVKEYEMVSM